MKDIKIQTNLATRLIKLLQGKSILFAVLVFLFAFNGKITSQDLRDLEHTLKFADYLFKTRQFILAAEEYERAVYYDSTNNRALLRLFQSYRYAEKHDVANQRFKLLLGDSIYHIQQDLAKEYVNNLFLRKEFKPAFDYLKKNASLNGSDKQTYQLGSILLQKKWDDAFQYALKHPVTNDKKNADIHVVAFRSKQQKYKSPFVAGMFSTIIPGTGKMYTKNWKDGIISLVFVGVNIWQAYRGFNKYGEDSVYGWIFAGFATSFYIGNIFGSAKSAKKYNKKLDDQIYNEAWHLMVNDM